MNSIDIVTESQNLLVLTQQALKKAEKIKRLVNRGAEIIMFVQFLWNRENIYIITQRKTLLEAEMFFTVYTNKLFNRNFWMLMFFSLFSVADNKIFRIPSNNKCINLYTTCNMNRVVWEIGTVCRRENTVMVIHFLKGRGWSFIKFSIQLLVRQGE